MNPISSLLNYLFGALLVLVVVYSLFQKYQINTLKGENKTLIAQEQTRKVLADEAIKANKIKEKENAERTKQQERDNGVLREAVVSKSLAVNDLAVRLVAANRLRNAASAGSCAASQSASAPGLRLKADPPLVSGGSDDPFAAVVGIVQDLAREADLVRADMITCQNYVMGLK